MPEPRRRATGSPRPARGASARRSAARGHPHRRGRLYDVPAVRFGAPVNDELTTLWALNGLDERLVAAKSALERFPVQRRSVDDRLAAGRSRLDTLKKDLADFLVRRRQMEKDIEALLAEERRYQSQLPLVKKNEEYAALLHEIAGAKQRGSERETELLTLMDAEDRRQAE